MGYQQLTYGTLVIMGLATVGTTIYTLTTDFRQQVKAVDVIELVEGVRERQMIAATITRTNVIGLQVASNRLAMVDLDEQIIALIPHFVNFTKLAEWAQTYSNNPPPRWTIQEIFETLEIGNRTNQFTRTPRAASSNDVATYGAWPEQLYVTDFKERFKVLQALFCTDDSTQWGSNATWIAGVAQLVDFTNASVVIPVASGKRTCSDYNKIALEGYVITNEPDWFETYMENDYQSFAGPPSTNTSFTIGYGDNPTYRRSEMIDVNSFEIKEYASIDGFFVWQAHYETFRNVMAYATSSITASKIECAVAKLLPLNRLDLFFDNHVGIEQVFVPSNTALSMTAGYIHPQTDTGEINLHVETVVEEWNFLCFDDGGSYNIASLERHSPNETQTVYDAATIINTNHPMEVVHQWQVTRCGPD